LAVAQVGIRGVWHLALLGICAVRHLRCQAPALLGTCAVGHSRCSALA